MFTSKASMARVCGFYLSCECAYNLVIGVAHWVVKQPQHTSETVGNVLIRVSCFPNRGLDLGSLLYIPIRSLATTRKVIVFLAKLKLPSFVKVGVLLSLQDSAIDSIGTTQFRMCTCTANGEPHHAQKCVEAFGTEVLNVLVDCVGHYRHSISNPVWVWWQMRGLVWTCERCHAVIAFTATAE